LIRIVGIGSPFGDDAVGLEVARILSRTPPLGCEVIVADRAGLNLIDLLDHVPAAILIDAVRSGAPAGTFHQLSFVELSRSTAQFVSSHELGIAVAVQLALKLGRGPVCGKVLGIEIAPVLARVPCPIGQTAQHAISRALTLLPLWVNELKQCLVS
jgi:hydrogenase maturation protease